MHFNEFAALRRDYDWELQHLADLNLTPEQLKTAKEKILKAKERAEYRRAYDQANKDKINAQRRRYYQSHKEEINASTKKYRENNKEKVAAQRKSYREAHKEQELARVKRFKELNPGYDKKWREANPDKVAAYEKKRYQQKKNKNESLIESLDYHIHEVSVNLWKKAAQNSLPSRTWNKEHRFMYRNIDPYKAVDRLRHAEYVAKLPNSNRSANSVKKAADNSLISRISNQKKQRERAVKAVSLSNAAKGKGIDWDEISDIMKKGIRFSKYDRSN